MLLSHDDQIALRAAEQAVLRTTAWDRPTPRRAFLRAVKLPMEPDPARLDRLADAGYLEDADDRDANPARGVRRLVATEKGRVEWRCAVAEDLVLAMRMDDVFHVAGTMVSLDVTDSRYHVASEAQPDLRAPEWTIEHVPADPEAGTEEDMVSYRRTVKVDAIVNHLGEMLTAWNPTEREAVTFGRFPAHSTGARMTMSGYMLVALDAAVNHRLYFQGGHTHYQTACGARGGSASSDARNILLRFGLIEAGGRDERHRREDYRATRRGIAFHALALRHAADMNDRDARAWRSYASTVAVGRAA